MEGLGLSRGYYEEYGAEMIRTQFPELDGIIAVGLVGSGSECYGYDDEVSEDHDFEPGFCMFIPDEDYVINAIVNVNEGIDVGSSASSAGSFTIDSKLEFQLSRAYSKLPDEFNGYKRNHVSPVGGSRHGVIRIGDFWKKAVGVSSGELDMSGWLHVPEYALAEATNGEIFRDDLGLYSKIRKGLRHYPSDIRKKKLAGYLLLMEQAGEYNYPRCIAHGETAAAQLAVSEFVKATMHAIFLINDRYMPYYKWAFRALRSLAMLAPLCENLEYLLTSPNTPAETEKKLQIIKDIQRDVICVVKLRGFTDMNTDNLEQIAYAVNDGIEDNNLRNMHILCGVE